MAFAAPAPFVGQLSQREALGRELVRRRHEIDLLELEFSELAAQFAATAEAERQGFATPVDWIRINCHMLGPAAADRVAVGQHLAVLADSVLALLGGEIGFGHLIVMTRTADALSGSPTASPFDEKVLLDKARESTVGKLYYFCRHLRHAQDPKGFVADEAEGVEARCFEIRGGGTGMVYLRGFLDSAGGAVLRTALEPLARKSGIADHRDRKRRLADALVDLASSCQQTHLQVTTSLETLVGMAGAPAADVEFSLPISAKAVERIACDCSVTRVLLGSDSVIIDVGRSKRVVSGPIRRALNARDGGCRWPGCDRPASWSAAHHVVHWTRGGSSDLDNLILLCHRHHRMVHEGNWQIVRGEDAVMLTVPPPVHFGHRARGPD